MSNIASAMTSIIPRLALTPGEPAGIGPDLVVQIAQQGMAVELVAIADPALLRQRAADLGLPLELREFDSHAPAREQLPGTLTCLPVELAASATAGVLDPANSTYVIETLDRAAQGCLAGSFAAMVTAPVHKGIINDAGIPFSGHTEFLEAITGSSQSVMLLACPSLRVALVTTHLPLAEVSAHIDRDRLRRVLEVLHHDLQWRFAIPSPRISVCGLNPHAGEGGHLGREEIEVIDPVLKDLRAQGFELVGPLPADTAFTPSHLQGIDVVLSMYHDQGLPVLKHLGFGEAVNITLGLPIIRTSVDHGTALDLAGTGKGDPGSLMAAIHTALEMSHNTLAAARHPGADCVAR